MKIRVKGVTRWAKNRIHQHGEIFEVFVEKDDRVLVYSLNETFKLKKDVWQKWCGWFIKGTEVEILERTDG